MIRKLVKLFIPKNLFRKIEPLGHLCEAILLNALHGFPSRGLKVIGVTGTNGKTTTAFLIHRMLQNSGRKTGLMTTVAYGVGDDIKPQQTHMTTASVPVLLKRIKAMKAEGIDWLVLETTSHALAQHRVWGVPFSISVLTNITHEHISYHGTFERYVKAKRMLFTQTELNTKGMRTGIINGDDPNADVFAQAVSHPVLYGTEGAQLQATNIELKPTGVEYDAIHGENTYHITSKLAGSFNVYNTLAAVGVGEAVGLTKSEIEEGIAALAGVEGRMTHIDEGQDFNVIVDYAHTPDSFERLFKDMKPVVKGKLIVLFGSLGGGDEGKRAVQGELAGTYANEVIITTEDDREEPHERIRDMITAGATKAGKTVDKDLFMVKDRTEAIQFAIDHAKKDDTVLLLGKGHEKTLEDATGTHPWDEIGTAHAAIKKHLARETVKKISTKTKR
jgi:UDP-N-acetylmuramoyl-L-alanyl-D-glutamate--2,6-diaminopimelate ligase